MQVLATIHYKIFRRDGPIFHSNTGYIDPKTISKELLKLNLGEIKIDVGEETIRIYVDTITKIEYTMYGEHIVLDCSEYFNKCYDRRRRCISDKEDIQQPMGYIKNQEKKKKSKKRAYKISNKRIGREK